MEKHGKPDYNNTIRKIQNEENSTGQTTVSSINKQQGKNKGESENL